MNRGGILILEDEAIIAMDIEMTLEDAGLGPVTVCGTLSQAMAQLEGGMPRVALLDFNLGGGEDSLPVAQRLQDAGVPFLFLTGYTEATVTLPDGLTVASRLTKPFQSADLLKAIRTMLGDP